MKFKFLHSFALGIVLALANTEQSLASELSECTEAEECLSPLGGGESFEDFRNIGNHSNIMDYLDPELVEDEDAMLQIKKSLLSGELVKIQNAFKPDFAEYIWSELDKKELNWTRSQFGGYSPTVPGHISPKHRIMNMSSEIKGLFDMFGSTASKQFMEKLSGRNVMEKPNFASSWYKEGDYSMQHSDHTRYRSISFIWNLSKDWDPTWGGAFFWESAKSLLEGFHYPGFNTLVMFIPSPRSAHSVTPVTAEAKGKRLSIVGWFNVDVEMDGPKIQYPLEDMYARPEDCYKLSQHQMQWLAKYMDPERAEDESRWEKLEELKTKVKDNCILQLHNSKTLIVGPDEEETDVSVGEEEAGEWLGDGGEMGKLEEAEPAENPEENKTEEKAEEGKTVVTPEEEEDVVKEENSDDNADSTDSEPPVDYSYFLDILKKGGADDSIANYLDPELLEDDEIMEEMKKSLLEGELVAIADAFKPEFAEFVWNELNREEIWGEKFYNSGVKGNKYVPGFNSKKHRLASKDKDSNVTTEELSPSLDAVFRMFDTTASKDFIKELSGRQVSGDNIIGAAWYKETDYTMHHNDLSENKAVSFVWNLSKKWDPNWGGSLFWSSNKSGQPGYHYSTFNTLFLFIPRMSSIHTVTPVTPFAEGKRLSLYGWFNVDIAKDGPSLQDPIEDMYTTEEDCTRLSYSQAEWIARRMDPKDEADESRREKLVDLKKKVHKNCLSAPPMKMLLVE